MGKYAYAKIEYYIIPQVNGLVNRFHENIFQKSQNALVPKWNEGYFYCIKNLKIPFAQPSQAGTFASSHSTTVGISAVVRSPM